VDDLSHEEELFDRYVKAGNIEAATRLLFDLIVRCAETKNFAKAESLRERLFDFDPIALNKIVESAEIIENKKREAIDKDHLDTWSLLYDTLTVEEANAFYYSMKKQAYDAEQSLIKKGEPNAKLYFINQGQLKMIYDDCGKEVLLKTLSPGDIAGEDTFFNISDCTTTIVTLTPVEVNFLDREILLKWKNEVPGIESKLIYYCKKSETAQDLLEKKKIDRRYQKRVNMSGRIVLQPLNISGEPEGNNFKGDLADISVGGTSIFIYRSNKEMARRLLGRSLNMQFALSVSGSSSLDIDKTGVVIGVSDRMFNEYCIHMKFDELLREEVVEEFERCVLKGGGSEKLDPLVDIE